jgi:hypothetical protein
MKQRIVFFNLISLVAMFVAVGLFPYHTKPLQAGDLTGTTATGKDTQFETSIGMLTRNVKVLKGAKLKVVSPGKVAISFGFIYIDPKNAFPIEESIEIYMGDKPDHPAMITLVRDLKSGKWLVTDGYIFYKDPKYMLLDGDTVKIIGGKDNPVYIDNQPFADTTVYIRNGKPHLNME